MAQKVMLSNRLDESVVARLKASGNDVEATIVEALDALDRERALPATVDERMKDMTQVLSNLVDALSKKAEPFEAKPVLSDKQKMWLFDQIAYIAIASESATKVNGTTAEVDAKHQKIKQAMGL